MGSADYRQRLMAAWCALVLMGLAGAGVLWAARPSGVADTVGRGGAFGLLTAGAVLTVTTLVVTLWFPRLVTWARWAVAVALAGVAGGLAIVGLTVVVQPAGLADVLAVFLLAGAVVGMNVSAATVARPTPA